MTSQDLYKSNDWSSPGFKYKQEINKIMLRHEIGPFSTEKKKYGYEG